MATLSEKWLTRVAVLSGMSLFVILLLMGLWHTNGVFVYSLDDPYIHLSMAEQIMRGGYGINPGEYASADSSILYPVLLLPFVGTGYHVFMPLVLNALALGVSLILLAKIVYESGMVARGGANMFTIALVILAPVALNFQGLALLGMEHMLQVATVLMAVLGLHRWLQSGKLNALLIVAILLGPLFRYESLGLSLLLSAALFMSGHKKLGAGLAMVASAEIVAFGLWLKSLGLSFLPNSVMAKAAIVDQEGSTLWALLTHNFNQFGNTLFATIFILLSLALFIVAARPWFRLNRPSRLIAIIAALAGFGHAILGRFGWADRYEIYALTLLATAGTLVIAPLLAGKSRESSLAKIGLIFALSLGFVHYFGSTAVRAVYGPANIYSQQWQMAELARRYESGPVLVNDIGLPSFQNDKKIVDLYGLASIEALNARRNRAARGWPNRIAEREGAGMAMVYSDWLEPSLGEGWQAVAYLDLKVPYKFVEERVTIYATQPEEVGPIRALLTNYAPELPRFSEIVMIEMPLEPIAEEGQ